MSSRRAESSVCSVTSGIRCIILGLGCLKMLDIRRLHARLQESELVVPDKLDRMFLSSREGKVAEGAELDGVSIGPAVEDSWCRVST